MTVSKVGIRELRQNLSVYVRRVKQGEEFLVTERGVEVARLTGADGSNENWLDRMRREGRTTQGPGGLPRPVLGHLSPEVKQAIMDDLTGQRGERR